MNASDKQDSPSELQDPRRAIRKLNLIGFTAIVLLIGGLGSWAATSQLTGAVIAAGSVVVESNVKKVQHPTGGVVGQIFVREGSMVEAGQVVIRLDDTVTRSTLGVVRSQLDEALSREARLRAERDGAERVTFPQELLDRAAKEDGVAAAMAGEERLFDSRRTGREGQRSQLRERISQSKQEITGLTAQQDAKENEIKFISEELVGVSQLYKQNLVSIQRFMGLQRDQARLSGERGQFIAEIARARAKISETELQILQLDQDFRTDVLKDMRETQGKIAELKERLTAAEDQLKRIDIRAPQAGVVHQLSVHTVGGVIANGETLMQIIPVSDTLLVEAKVAPQDVDQVALGAKATVRIMAGNQRTMSDIITEVSLIGADLTKDKDQPNQPAYYVVRVPVPAEEVQRLDQLKLVPGMPAEVFIQTRERTALDFLMKPLREQITRTFRER
jgi:membrane fusion protein, type I secretion system